MMESCGLPEIGTDVVRSISYSAHIFRYARPLCTPHVRLMIASRQIFLFGLFSRFIFCLNFFFCIFSFNLLLLLDNFISTDG